MTELVVTVGKNGRVTIPANVRRILNVGPGDQLAFVLTDEGTVAVRMPRFTLDSVLGSLEALPNESLDLDREIEEAVAEGMARKMKRLQQK